MMELIIDPFGDVQCLYDETINLAALGRLDIKRASHVEADSFGGWWSDLSPVGGPPCGPFEKRSDALEAEKAWIEDHVLQLPSMLR